MKDFYRNRIELLRGTFDLLVLQTLRWAPHFSYAIARILDGPKQEFET